MTKEIPERTCWYGAAFELGDRVTIDGDASLVAVVTAFCWRESRPEVEVSWFHCGAHHTAWVAERRLDLVSAAD